MKLKLKRVPGVKVKTRKNKITLTAKHPIPEFADECPVPGFRRETVFAEGLSHVSGRSFKDILFGPPPPRSSECEQCKGIDRSIPANLVDELYEVSIQSVLDTSSRLRKFCWVCATGLEDFVAKSIRPYTVTFRRISKHGG